MYLYKIVIHSLYMFNVKRKSLIIPFYKTFYILTYIIFLSLLKVYMFYFKSYNYLYYHSIECLHITGSSN